MSVSASFRMLAVFGEAIVNNIHRFSKYLLTNSISYSFNEYQNRFNVFSPIDQRILFNTLKQLAQQSKTDWLTYSYQKLNWKTRGISEKFIKIILTYYLLNHFADIAQEFYGSYLSDYSLKASYYVNDTLQDINNVIGTSLMLNALYQTSSMNESIMRDGLYAPSFSEMLILPKYGTDILGILVRDCPIIEKESYIPFVCATQGYGRYLYKDTDIKRRFDYEDSVRQNNQTSNSCKMLRILFHPNGFYTTSLKERISDYSLDSDTCEMEYSNNAIMTDKGHLVYEINASNEKWIEFTKQMGWLEEFNNLDF